MSEYTLLKFIRNGEERYGVYEKEKALRIIKEDCHCKGTVTMSEDISPHINRIIKNLKNEKIDSV